MTLSFLTTIEHTSHYTRIHSSIIYNDSDRARTVRSFIDSGPSGPDFPPKRSPYENISLLFSGTFLCTARSHALLIGPTSLFSLVSMSTSSIPTERARIISSSSLDASGDVSSPKEPSCIDCNAIFCMVQTRSHVAITSDQKTWKANTRTFSLR